MCLYFFLQLGSGHSMMALRVGLSVPDVPPREHERLLLLLLLDPLPLSPLPDSVSSVWRALRLTPEEELSGRAGLAGAGKLLLLPRRVLRSLRPSAMERSLEGVPVAARPRFPRPLGVRVSKSLTGESQFGLQQTHYQEGLKKIFYKKIKKSASQFGLQQTHYKEG